MRGLERAPITVKLNAIILHMHSMLPHNTHKWIHGTSISEATQGLPVQSGDRKLPRLGMLVGHKMLGSLKRSYLHAYSYSSCIEGSIQNLKCNYIYIFYFLANNGCDANVYGYCGQEPKEFGHNSSPEWPLYGWPGNQLVYTCEGKNTHTHTHTHHSTMFTEADRANFSITFLVH